MYESPSAYVVVLYIGKDNILIFKVNQWVFKVPLNINLEMREVRLQTKNVKRTSNVKCMETRVSILRVAVLCSSSLSPIFLVKVIKNLNEFVKMNAYCIIRPKYYYYSWSFYSKEDCEKF